MIAFQIKDTKAFMQLLLMKEYFDHFLVEEATITTFNTFHIDGRIMKDFYSKEELEENPARANEFSTWQDIRPIAFQLIKGKKTPLGFQFVFHLHREAALKLLANEECTVPENALKAFVLNIKYDGTHVTCITATALNTFLMDKSADVVWDKAVNQFFTKLNINFDVEK